MDDDMEGNSDDNDEGGEDSDDYGDENECVDLHNTHAYINKSTEQKQLDDSTNNTDISNYSLSPYFIHIFVHHVSLQTLGCCTNSTKRQNRLLGDI